MLRGAVRRPGLTGPDRRDGGQSLPTTARDRRPPAAAGSGEVAQRARRQILELGCVGAQVLTVDVGTSGGPEAAARTARYAALNTACAGAPVLLAHTLDDRPTVLLGLGRGSGPRSIAGMRRSVPPLFRPLLGIRAPTPTPSARNSGWPPGDDPHNSDRRFHLRAPAHGRCCPCWRRSSAGVWLRRWPTPPLRCEDTDALDAMAGRSWPPRSRRRAGDRGHRPAADGGASTVIRSWLPLRRREKMDGQANSRSRRVAHLYGARVGGRHDRPNTRLFAERSAILNITRLPRSDWPTPGARLS